jgi:hypothetical protein
MKRIFLMTQNRFHFSADDMSRGKDFWRASRARAERSFRRSTNDIQKQRILDFVGKCNEAVFLCPTYSPCSRTAFLPGGSL